MKLKPLMLPLFGAAFLLGSCGGETTSSSQAASSSEEASSLPTSSTGGSSSEPTGPITAIDAAYLETLAAASFEGEATLDAYGSLTSIDFFLGPNSMKFIDVDAYGTYYSKDFFYRQEDGTTMSYFRDVDNQIFSSSVYVPGSVALPAEWDVYFYNPFAKLAIDDLTPDGNGYAVSSDKVQAFSIPFVHYTVGTFDAAHVSRSDDALAIEIEATDEYGEKMSFSYRIEISTTVDLPLLEPYAKEEWHEDIDKALEAWTLALSGPSDLTGFVYEKTMTPLDNDAVDVATSKTTVTYNATLFANDGGLTSANDWGYATFDDGKCYEFEIVDGEVVRGEAYDGQGFYWIPYPSIVAAEMFVPTDEEGTYAYRDPTSAAAAVQLFLEDESVISFLSYFGAVKDLTIHLNEEGTIDNFSYTNPMFAIDGSVYSERVSVDIKEFDTATIDYDFLIPEIAMPEAMKNTWVGNDYYTLDRYVLVIADDGITLNGEEATLLGLQLDKWGNYVGTLNVASASYQLTYMPANGTYPDQINISSSTVDATLKVEVPVTMPAEIIGSWEGVDETSSDPYQVTVNEDGTIIINGKEATLGAWEETTAPAGGYRVSATVDGMTYLLTYRPAEGTFRLTDETGAIFVDLQKVPTEPETPAIDPKYVGTWTGVDEWSGLSHTLVIKADGTATLDGKAFDEPLEFRQVIINVKATATLDGLEYTLEYSEAKGTIRLYDKNYDIDVTLTLQEAPAAPTLEFPESYVGTWKTEDGAHTIVFGEDGTATYDGTAVASMSGTGFEDEYTLLIDGEEYSLSYIGYSGDPFFMLVTPEGGYLMLYKA